MKNILIDMEMYAPVFEKLKNIEGVNLSVIEPYEDARYVDPAIIRDINFLFCTCPPENIDNMKSLEVIQIASAGYTQLFGINLSQRGIRACNAAGVNDIPIAQWNIAMMINLMRNLRQMIRNQEAGIWDRSASFQQDLFGKTVGLWGYGGIGRETARLAKAIGLKVHVLDVKVQARPTMYCVEGTGDPEGIIPDKVFGIDQQKDFLGELDFLVLSMPLTNKTKGIVGKEHLEALPQRAYILNPARGPLIQEQALLDILRRQGIAGVALDTHYYYPMPADHPLWRFPNVIMTPHISGSTSSPNFLSLLWDVMFQNVQRYLNDEVLLNELNPSQLAGD